MSNKVEYHDNVNEITLFSGSDVVLTNGTIQWRVHIPTIKELYSSVYERGFFIAVLTENLETLTKNSPIKFDSKLEFIKYLLKTPGYQSEGLRYFFNLCSNGKFQFLEELDRLTIDGSVVNEQILEWISLCIRLGMGRITLKEFRNQNSLGLVKSKEEDEWDKQIRANEARIKQTKSKTTEGDIVIQNMLLVISQVFGTSIEELVNKNFYTLNSMYVAALKYDVYSVNIIAEGAGMVKKGHKHVHWSNMK